MSTDRYPPPQYMMISLSRSGKVFSKSRSRIPLPRCTACGSVALKRFAGRLRLRHRRPSFLFAIVIGCKQSVGLIPTPGFIPR